MQGRLYILRTAPSTHFNPTQPTNFAQPNAISISLMLVLPVVVVLALVGYRKHRATVLQRQIKLLNQLWQLDSSKNLT